MTEHRVSLPEKLPLPVLGSVMHAMAQQQTAGTARAAAAWREIRRYLLAQGLGTAAPLADGERLELDHLRQVVRGAPMIAETDAERRKLYAQALHQVLVAEGHTQLSFAQRVGLDKVEVSLLLRAQILPDAATRARIQRALPRHKLPE